jgi:hypothetical protein
MATSSHTGPGSWRIAMEATGAALTVGSWRGKRLLYELPRLSGAFYLRPGGTLAGFDLRLPLPEGGELTWDSADLDRRSRSRLRFGGQEVRAAVSVLCVEVPGEHPYWKIVLEAEFSSWRLRLPGAGRCRPVTLTVFSEIRDGSRGLGAQEEHRAP